MSVVVVVLVWLVGALLATGVFRVRAGLPFMSILPVHMFFTSFPWIITTGLQCLLWPISLIVWLVRGRPSSPWSATRTARGNIKVVRVAAQPSDVSASS